MGGGEGPPEKQPHPKKRHGSGRGEGEKSANPTHNHPGRDGRGRDGTGRDGRHTYDDEERCCFLYVLLPHVVLFFLFALRFQQLYSRSFKTGTWRFQQLYRRYGKNLQLVVSPFAC